MPSYVQCKKTGKFIPKEEYYAGRPEVNFPTVHGDFKSFVSPITNEVISDRGQMRRHCAQHGVTPTSDYSPQYIESRSKKRVSEALGKTPGAKKERVELIKKTLAENGVQ